MSNHQTSSAGDTPRLLVSLDAQAERAVTALELCQRQRDELREERDAAIAAHAELLAAARNLIDHWPTTLPYALAQRLATPAFELRAVIDKTTGSAF